MARRGDGGFAVLIAAHGETSGGEENSGVLNIASALRGRRIAHEIAAGFLKGQPSVADTVAEIDARDIVVYPLFFSEGYFTRVRLPQMLEQGKRREQTIDILAPLGLEPALADLVLRKAESALNAQEIDPREATLILLGHGSRKDQASRRAAKWLARCIDEKARLRSVRTAFLEEPPALQDAAADVKGPVVVAGLFSGNGLHGGVDTGRLLAALGRDAVFAGNVGNYLEIVDIVAAALEPNALATAGRTGKISAGS